MRIAGLFCWINGRFLAAALANKLPIHPTVLHTMTPANCPPARTPFSVEDLYLHLHITDMHCTANGNLAACVVRSVDQENDTYQSKIWTYALDGSSTAQFTQPPGSDTAPRWSPDGQQLAFVSNRSGNAQIHVLSRTGGEAQQLTWLPSGVSNLRWMPDGKSMVVTAAVKVDPDLRGTRSAEPAKPVGPRAPEVAWRLPYKADDIGYILNREIHLFAVDAVTGVHTQLTDGPFDVLAHDISTDGEKLAYVRTREGRFAHAADLWTCRADGTGHKQVTRGHANVMQPLWSPDGRHISFVGAVLQGDAESRLWLVDVSSGKSRQLGDVEVALPESVQWSEDGQGIVFVRAHRGRHQIARIGLDGELTVLLDRDHQIGAFGCTGSHFAMTVLHPAVPSELHVCEVGSCNQEGVRQISDLNPWWKERVVINAETIRFSVPDPTGGEEEIEGWLLRAEGNTGPAPLLNDIHGGPASYAQLGFDTSVYRQVLCSQGWAVLALNAVGSASYGRDFCHKLEGHWGTYDLPQHLVAVKQLQDEGVCDDRLAVCGKSYGGYLTAWTIGHTDMFKAAVVMAPVGNIETHYGTSDGGYYADPFYMATAPYFDRERARRLSPLQTIEQSGTPTLFLQGKEDERCPKCQSEELFVSLMRAGKTPTEMVLYPGEAHGFLAEGAPACRADAARRIVDWVTQHCATVAVPETAPQEMAEPA